MKRIALIFTAMLICVVSTAQELKMNFSNATGSGWAVLSSTAETVTLKQKTQTYLLITDSFKVSEFKNFKLTFGQKPENVHIYIRGLNEAGEDKMNFMPIKLEGLTMTAKMPNLVEVTKLGIRFGTSDAEQTEVNVESFYLVDNNGALIPTILPSVSDAQKMKTIWSREFGNSAEIIYTGNYNRELEWAPEDINDYNTLTIEFNEPLAQDLDVRVKMNKGQKEETGYKSAAKGATSMTINLKKDYKDKQAEITRILFVGKSKGDKVSFKSLTLSK